MWNCLSFWLLLVVLVLLLVPYLYSALEKKEVSIDKDLLCVIFTCAVVTISKKAWPHNHVWLENTQLQNDVSWNREPAGSNREDKARGLCRTYLCLYSCFSNCHFLLCFLLWRSFGWRLWGLLLFSRERGMYSTFGTVNIHICILIECIPLKASL